ncbi:MAG TPA: NF038122 family metalloprotease [Pyrinomonadaceae bacterium]|nr:NF038122 family metalloprotease [Pyrinomonadaceae bacterium]
MSQFPRSRFAPRRRNLSRTIFSARFRSFLALSLAALIFHAPFSFAASARAMNAQSGSSKAADSSSSALTDAGDNQQADGAAEQTEYTNFFIVKLINGEATCLDTTFAEAPISMPKDDTSGTLPATGQKPINPGYEYAHAQSTVVDNGNSITVGSGGLTINFNELSQLQGDADRANVVAAFIKAAQVWTDRIKSPVTITINIDYGPLVPGCVVNSGDAPDKCNFKSGVIGSTGSASIQVDYPGVRANLLKSSSSQSETNIYNALPAAEVPSEAGNGLGIEINVSTARALGYTASSNSATIGFNKAFPFDFDPSDGISTTKMDFIAVATHEIGHALGFTSGVDESSASSMSSWDFYRFRPGTTAATFATAPRVMSIGGPVDNPTQVYFTGQSFVFGSNSTPTSELGLSTGGSNPSTTTNKGDGNQSSHWRDDLNSSINYVGIMDPTISKGVHQEITENDLSALETMGWNLTGSAAGTGTGTLIPSAPPTPTAPANDDFASAQVINGCSGNLTSTNVGATRETGAGEPANPDSSGSTKSVWYQWQAPNSGSVTISTAGSRFDTTLAVYSGTSVGALGVAVAHNDDAPDDPNTVEREVSSSVTFNATKDTVYRIAVNGYNNFGTGDIGRFTLKWTQVNCFVAPPPIKTVELSQSAYATGEGGGSVAVAVTRNDSAAAANVDYATSDTAGLTPCNSFNGVASSRCDYATTIGTLRFAAGESTKTIFIPLVDDAWAEGAETFTLTLSIPTGATLGPNYSATITVSDNESTTSGVNPLDSNAFFIRQQYVDFLGREPDSVGLQGWLDVLNNCPASGKDTNGNFCDRVEVSAGFFKSKEFQERGYFIYKFYSAVGRIPLYPEFMPDLAKVSGFLSDAQLEANKTAFVTEFMNRSEFQAKYGAITDATTYVNALLNTVGLPNHPSKAGWIAGMNNGTLTNAKVLRELTESKEVYDKYFNEAFVIMQYFGYLRRTADISYQFWLGRLNADSTDYRTSIGGFINSDEYRKRFGQ